VGTGTVHGPYSYLFLVTPEGLRYMLPTPHYGMGDIDMDMGIGLEAMEGNRYFLEEPSGLLISWWMYCKYEIYPSLGSIPRRDGMLYYTLWLPAMEVYVYFEPDA